MTIVLFCEDDPVIQRLIQWLAMRSLAGYTVHIVSDGDSGFGSHRARAPVDCVHRICPCRA